MNTPRPQPDLLNVAEAARFLRVSPATVYRWGSRGYIPSVKIGGYRRFRRDDLAAWLDALAEPPTSTGGRNE